MHERVRVFWREFVAGYEYCRDPHGWWQQRKKAARLKYGGRPGMFLMGDGIIVHPARARQLQQELGMQAPVGLPGLLTVESFDGKLAGRDVYVSELAEELPPAGGWPDIELPVRPRLAP